MTELLKINVPGKYVNNLKLMYTDFCNHWIDMGMDPNWIPSFE